MSLSGRDRAWLAGFAGLLLVTVFLLGMLVGRLTAVVAPLGAPAPLVIQPPPAPYLLYAVPTRAP